MKKEEIIYLRQLFVILEKKLSLLENSYEKKDVGTFTRIKKELIETQKKINSTIK